jgi:hypothetical protein
MRPQSRSRSCHENIKTLNFVAQIAVADIFSKPYTSPMKLNNHESSKCINKTHCTWHQCSNINKQIHRKSQSDKEIEPKNKKQKTKSVCKRVSRNKNQEKNWECGPKESSNMLNATTLKTWNLWHKDKMHEKRANKNCNVDLTKKSFVG